MSSQADDKKTLKSIDMKEEQFRIESDLLGELQVPSDALYGVQTQRGINNYHISRKRMCDYPMARQFPHRYDARRCRNICQHECKRGDCQ